MAEPTTVLTTLRASTADLLKGLEAERWSDDDLAAPSLCAGWTRGHVLTHLARNADGIADTLAGALRGEIVARYPDGWDARNAAIDAGAGRHFTELVADVRESAERLDRVFAALHDRDGWGLPTAEDVPAAHWPAARLREVEIHRVDLDGDYGPHRWPPAFVADLLPQAAASLAGRAEVPVRVTVSAERSLGPEHVGARWAAGEGEPVTVEGPDWAVLAWLVGRGEIVAEALSAVPPLRPWR